MLAWNKMLEGNSAWRVGNYQGGAMDITTHVVAAPCKRAVGGQHARRRSFLRQVALFALFAGAPGLEAPAYAQHPVTLWITGVSGHGAFPPDWYPLLGSSPAEACAKFVGAGVQAEARAYEQRVQTYGAEWVCPPNFQVISPAPACVYRAYPSYTKQSPGQACTTSTVESTLANLPFRFAAGESKGAGQSEFGSCQRANPVNLGNGNKLQSEVDYRGAGALPLELVRTYNSRGVLPDGRIGRGWRHGFEASIALDDSIGTAMAHRPNGAVYVFARTGVQWTPDKDIPDRLERVLDASNQPAGWRYRPTGAEDRVEVYDRDGRLSAIEDKAGRALTLQYASHALYGKLLSAVLDPVGRALAFSYDSAGRVRQLVDPAGGRYGYEYDATGNLIAVTFPDLETRRYHYEKSGDAPTDGSGYVPDKALTGITDENGARFATFDYDGAGRTTLSEHALSAERTTFSHGAGSVTVTDALGAVRSYALEAVLGTNKNSATTGDPGCPLGFAARSFDANGMPDSQTDWNGNLTRYTRNARGLETLRVEGAGKPEERRITTDWHPFYRLALRIAEPVRVTSYIYGEPTDPNPGNRGRVLARTVQATADATGAQGFSAAPVGAPRTWTYTYNAEGRVLTVDGPRTDVSDVTAYAYHPNDDPDLGKRGNVATTTNALGHITRFTAYDPHGKPLTLVDPNGVVTTLAYDPRQRLVSRDFGGELTSYEYDGVGQVTKVTLPDGSFLSYTYDAAHRLMGIADSPGNRIAYTLDAMGNRTREEVFDSANQLAQVRSRLYNALNRLEQEIGGTSPASQVTRFGYDNQGNLTGITDPLNRLTANAYDALNRLKQITDPASGLTRYGYDGLDQLASVTDPRNNTTAYGVDGLGNLAEQRSPDTGTSANTYDAAGNRLSAVDAKGQTTNFTYDALNRVTRVVYSQATGTQLKQIDYAYDQGANGIGRLRSLTETSAAGAVLQATTYAYDARGRITEATRAIAGTSHTVRYAYDPSGRLTQMTYPSGRTLAYGLDGLGRINRIETTGAGQTHVVVQDATYQPFGPVKRFTFGNLQAHQKTFDLDGRIASHSLASQGKLVSFDAASRITRIEEQENTANFSLYGYDALDRVTSTVLAASTFSYGYDAVGNRTSKSTGASTDIYSYSPTSNRLAEIAGATIRSYAHDPNGSIIAAGPTGFGYDVRGRLIASSSAAGTTTYQVNALGQRVRKTSALADTLFHYDDEGRLIAESGPSGAPVREYLWFGEQPVAVATYPVAGNQCASLPTADTSNTFVAFSRRERMEVHAGRPGERGWEWGLGTNTRNFEASARADLDWVSGKPYAFTLVYDGAGNARVSVRDGDAELFALTWTGGMDVGNALRFTVRSPEGIGVGNRIALNITAIDGQPMSTTLATAGDDARSEVTGVYAGTSLQDGYTVEGTVTLTFSKNYPPRGNRLDFTVTAGTVQCQGEGPGTPTLYYVHADHLNTPRAVTNQSQQVVWRWENQEPFGNNPAEENPGGLGSFEFPLRFPRHLRGSRDQHAHNYFRDYDPATGRYVQSDPIGLAGGINPYAYGASSPLIYDDVFGLQTYMCTQPLHALGGTGLRSGPDIWGNPLYHKYICVPDGNDSIVCGGQDRAGGPFSPGIPSKDTFKENGCKVVEPSNDCIESCLRETIQDPQRPRYWLFGGGRNGGQNCQQWADTIIDKCRRQCKTAMK